MAGQTGVKPSLSLPFNCLRMGEQAVRGLVERSVFPYIPSRLSRSLLGAH